MLEDSKAGLLDSVKRDCTKLVILYSLGQALRYLRDYKIVHLDLKPTNVMMYCNYFIKLIDFGEAYHPKTNKG